MTYSHNTYGDAFADVYDEWYQDLDDIDECSQFLVQLAERGTVLELGVGTGRIAIPLSALGAEFGVSVVGIDSSMAMLERLNSKQSDNARVHTIHGHMVREMPNGPFSLVLLAYNTLFNLLSADEQSQCLNAAVARLSLGGHVVVDCFVPGDELPCYIAPHLQRTTPRGVVMSEATVDIGQQLVDGVFTEVRNDGTRFERPWRIRYSSVADIDAMATAAGLHCEQRWSSYVPDAFTKQSVRHISVYGRLLNHRA